MLSLLYINWDISPYIFKSDTLNLKWYGLLFSTAFFAVYLILLFMFRKESIPERKLNITFLLVLPFTLIGLRLGHVFFYDWGYYSKHLDEIFLVWKGGLSGHGGIIATLIALFFIGRKTFKKSFIWILDRLSVAAILGGAFVRLGNTVNSELIGTPTELPWGFIFVNHHSNLANPLEINIPRHPVTLYEALAYFCIFAIGIILYRKKKYRNRTGFLLGWVLTLVFISRFLLEYLKDIQVSFEFSSFFSIGQLLSLPFILIGTILLLRKRKADISAN